MESILVSTKKLIGLSEDNHDFDTDIIIHINTVLVFLSQLGVMSEYCTSIEDETTSWIDLLGNATNLELIKSYVALKVKLLFDPPSNSTIISSTERLISELEWRILEETDYKKSYKEGKDRHNREIMMGTTPTLTFNFPFPVAIITSGYITFMQKGRIILDKPISECRLSDHTVYYDMTQEDTLSFDPGINVEIQIRVRCRDKVAASNMMSININRILKNEVI